MNLLIACGLQSGFGPRVVSCESAHRRVRRRLATWSRELVYGRVGGFVRWSVSSVRIDRVGGPQRVRPVARSLLLSEVGREGHNFVDETSVAAERLRETLGPIDFLTGGTRAIRSSGKSVKRPCARHGEAHRTRREEPPSAAPSLRSSPSRTAAVPDGRKGFGHGGAAGRRSRRRLVGDYLHQRLKVRVSECGDVAAGVESCLAVGVGELDDPGCESSCGELVRGRLGLIE